MLALADAGDWTPMSALETLLGKTFAATKRMVEAVNVLLAGKLIAARKEGSDPRDFCLLALPAEQWEKDDHFMLPSITSPAVVVAPTPTPIDATRYLAQRAKKAAAVERSYAGRRNSRLARLAKPADPAERTGSRATREA